MDGKNTNKFLYVKTLLKFYLGALLINCIAKIPNNNIGIHTANEAGRFPKVANTVEIFINKINAKVIAKPNARFNPIPPLTFREDKETPINVRTIVANGNEIL